MDVDAAIDELQKKIEKERILVNSAMRMKQATNNPGVQSRADSNIRDAHRNIQYFEQRLGDLRTRQVGNGMQNLSLGSGNQGGPPPPAHGVPQPQQRGMGPGQEGRTPDSAREDHEGDYGTPGPGGYSMGGGRGLMPPRAPYAPPSPASGTPKARPNYSKLDLIKYDTQHLGPRIQLMLSQLEFKLSVEKQYKDGIEKMVRLYQLEGDRKSKADAENRRIESNQKIQLLKQALRRYAELHVDIDNAADGADDDSLNVPTQRKPLSGRVFMRIHAVADVDHAATGRFSRGPETFVTVKVEDAFKGRTKATRTDKWTDENHEFDIDKANEIELTVYDKAGEHPVPIGMLWIRISDIAEEMRRKRIETEFNNTGWVSADKMNDGNQSRPDLQFNPPPGHQGAMGGPSSGQSNAPAPQSGPTYIESWFSLEPVGRIQLTMSFLKQTKDRRPFDVGLGRKGAIRQKKEEVVEQYGHKFVVQQFYNIMRCALCGDFLKYSAGMQCADCKYTCHRKCYPKVVTKCISKSNAESDPDEEKINHRIPHRFEVFSNMGANWCCHCGYMLPLGRKQCRKCTECGQTCHANCVHFVPDFCGMTMEGANQILAEIKKTKTRQVATGHSLTGRTLRPSSARPTPPPAQASYAPPPAQDAAQASQDQRLSYGQNRISETYEQPPRTSGYGPPSGTSVDAARASYNASGAAPSPQQARPPPTQRTQSSQSAAAAAAAALAGKRSSAQDQRQPYNRASTTDYPNANQRSSGGYVPPDHRTPQPQVQSQPPTYDPAAYAAVGGYPAQSFPQPHQQLQQQLHQQPPPAVKQSYPTPQIPQITQPTPPPAQQSPPTQSQPPSTAVTALRERKEPAPPANTAGTGKRIGLDHFNFLAVLGKGNFGKVMLAETKASKQLYAIKVLKKEFIIENDEVESTRSEKRVFLIANKEHHPFLLNLHACFQTETRVYFVMEYISGGDLMLHIQRGQFGTKRAQFYAAEVCLALKYFHENGVIYRDLKLDNILLTLDGHIKIADYGLCKEDMWYGSTTSTFCGTPEFMAPEILLDKKYGRAVDWWAFGVLIYQMLLQQSPFRGEDEDEIYDAILADEPLYPIHMPRDSVSILQKLLTREPELRLGSGPTDAQEIMSHAFFRNVNWEDIYHKRVQPPFLPTVKGRADTSNFDSEFTSVTPVLTPVQSVLSQAMQEEFRGFSYSADFV
ncbi:Serine/threonine kinase [Elasticomyces elasticus]|nr:Serine/threonine kinase [Elasticomyces elasticus]